MREGQDRAPQQEVALATPIELYRTIYNKSTGVMEGIGYAI